MNQVLQYSRLNNLRNMLVNMRMLSTKAQLENVLVEQDPINMPTKVIKKKAQRGPFMKNVFVGSFDCDILGFPEILNKDEYTSLMNNVKQLVSCMSHVDLTVNTSRLADHVRNHLKNFNIFGLQSTELVDGLELSETENCRLLEVLASSNSLAVSLICHQYFGVRAISTNNLSNKYLSRLSKGESIAAFCLLEEDNHDPSLMKTHATISTDGNQWILNGKKCWVINGSQSDIFVVVACTHADNSALHQDRFSVLLVEKSFGGVTCAPCHPAGLTGADICNVTFENTPVPKENILGEGADSIKVITPLLTSLRLSTGPVCITLLKSVIEKFAAYALSTKYGPKYLSDADFIRDKIAQLNINLYAIESMTYVTAGLLDRYENQDCNLEAAIVKVFSSEKCLESVQECVKLIGSPAYMTDHWLQPMHNDAMGHILLNETNDSLRIVIALLGLQHTGFELQDSVKKLRNPFFNPGYIIKKMFAQRRQAADDPKLDLGLECYLHPSLTLGARWLEYCVLRLQYAAETLLVRHGVDIMEQHMELKRLADVAIDLYAMVSVLSRASRSYCIGLQNADYELLLANAFCLDARDRIKHKVLEISRGPYGTNDINYQKIAKRSFKFSGYFPEHTLTKNF